MFKTPVQKVNAAIAKFKTIQSDLEKAATEIDSAIVSNEAEIVALEDANDALQSSSDQARTFAINLSKLVGD